MGVKKVIIASVLILSGITFTSASNLETIVYAQSEHNYVGAAVCGRRPCHGNPETGNQYEIWQNSAHAGAYNTLSTPEALAIGSERGIENPQQSGECLSCHITEYDASNIEDSYVPNLGIQCESCHGPGSDYKNLRIMRDREQAIINGLIIPDEQTCLRCHNENSPNFASFDYGEMLSRIQHSNP